ncbi:hypothetical protein [Branchiibius sp. NY16-3462-2]|uniref:hypothetical protein n=1 Tax=Branchiibius sp. NY16-3462-2 TaxID=1807500 RepID=UPI00079A1177|nr:hypothetical protein [Branchiibius sp. NY16-3462-2]KYH45877.1 hypothetical protein AZH51_09330 [Branchiibius sp. NY16-3462-2]
MILYLLIPAAGFLSPLLVIPAITSRFGVAGWTGMALAQSLGGAIAIATEMGWGVVGPQRVAGMSRRDGIAQYRLSLTSRPLTAIPGMVLAAALTGWLVDDHAVAAAILAAAMASQAMTPQWYFVGIGQPVAVLWSESLPKALLALISAIAILAGAPFVTYSLLMCLAMPIALIVARLIIGPEARLRRSDWAAATTASRQQLIIGSSRVVSVAYTGLPVTLVQIAAPEATPVFAATERLMRMGVLVLYSVPSRLQSWIGGADVGERAGRVHQAQRICLLMGVLAGVAYAALTPTVSRLMFSGAVNVPYSVSSASGVLLAVICTSMGLGLSMVATGQANLTIAAIIPAAIVALSTVGVMAIHFGATGAVIAEIAAELVGVAILWYLLRRHARRHAAS